MTVYDLDAPRVPSSEGLFARIGQWFGKSLRAMQHARMLQAMSELSDDQLETLGLKRADIPERARAAIYDTKF